MKDVAVDACCLINLLAADCVLPKRGPKDSSLSMEVKSLGLVLHIPVLVSSESLYIRESDLDDPTKLLKLPIKLSPYFDAGTLQECDVNGNDETALFVGFASKLDDGEAACLAIAKNRGWLLASDDRPAAKLAVEHGVSVLTTAEILKRWAVKTSAMKADITKAILNIQRFASFVPRANSPEASWWQSHITEV